MNCGEFSQTCAGTGLTEAGADIQTVSQVLASTGRRENSEQFVWLGLAAGWAEEERRGGTTLRISKTTPVSPSIGKM